MKKILGIFGLVLALISGRAIAQGTQISGSQIKDGAITTSKIAEGAVTASKFTLGIINNSHVAPNAAIAYTKINFTGATPLLIGAENPLTFNTPLSRSNNAISISNIPYSIINFSGATPALLGAESILSFSPPLLRTLNAISFDTSQLLMADGSAAAPAYSFASTPNLGFYRYNANTVGFADNGVNAAILGGSFLGMGAPFQLTWYPATPAGGGNDVTLNRRGPATLNLGGFDAASPVAQTISFQGSRGTTDTNTAGVNTTIQGSLGTGTAASGDLIFKVGTPQTTGSTQHVADTALTLHNAGVAGTPKPQVLVADGTVSFPSIAFANGGGVYGLYTLGYGALFWTTVSGQNTFAFSNQTGYDFGMTAVGQVGWTSSSSNAAGATDTVITRRAPATLSLGAADAASPVAQTLSFQGARGATDVNTAAVAATVQGSLGTGTGATGDIVFKVGTPQTTGSTQHVAATVMTLHNEGNAGSAAPQVRLADGSVTNPVLSFTNGPAVGLYLTDSNTLGVALASNRAATFRSYLDATANLYVENGLAIGPYGGNFALLNAPAANELRLGNKSSASPAAQTISFQGARGGTDTDTGAGETTIQGSLGTGTGASGDILFKVGTPQAAGNTQHVAAPALRIHNAGTGGTAAPQVLVTDGTAPAPSIARATDGNTGFWFGGSAIVLATSGTSRFSIIGDHLTTNTTSELGWGNPEANSRDVILSRRAPATLNLGAFDAASPVAQTLSTQGSRAGTDTDIGGANLTIQSGIGTGTGTPSSLVFKVPVGVGTGSGTQTATTGLTVAGSLAGVGPTTSVPLGAAATGSAVVIGTSNVNVTPVGTISDTNETDLMTYTLPANALSANGKGVRVTAWGTTAAAANNQTISLKFGSQIIGGLGPIAIGTNNWIITAMVIRTSSSNQTYWGQTIIPAVTTAFTAYTATQTDTNPIVIKCTGTNGVATVDGVKQLGLIVEFIN